MSRQEKNKLQFFVATIAEFASTYHLKQQQAFRYLKQFKGLEFLNKHYAFMHTQSFEDVIDSLTLICKQNGGKLS